MEKNNEIQLCIYVSNVPDYYLSKCRSIYNDLISKYCGDVTSDYYFENANDTTVVRIFIPEISLFMILDYLTSPRDIRVSSTATVTSADTEDMFMTMEVHYKEVKQ